MNAPNEYYIQYKIYKKTSLHCDMLEMEEAFITEHSGKKAVESLREQEGENIIIENITRL